MATGPCAPTDVPGSARGGRTAAPADWGAAAFRTSPTTPPAAQPLPGRPPPAWEQSVALFRPGGFCAQEPVPDGSAGLLYAKGHGIDSTSIYT